MRHPLTTPFIVLLLAVVALSAHAGKTTPPLDDKADTRDQFEAVAAHVRDQMAPGGRFEFVNADERQTVERDLSSMQALFDKFGTVDAMDTTSKVALYNAQSELNGVLTRRDGDREICEYSAPTGSNIPKTTCRKYSEIERQRQDTLKYKQDMLPMQNATNNFPKPESH